jgi:pyrophosphate--fructose-6-phosphate 1-phosphotransferase
MSVVETVFIAHRRRYQPRPGAALAKAGGGSYLPLAQLDSTPLAKGVEQAFSHLLRQNTLLQRRAIAEEVSTKLPSAHRSVAVVLSGGPAPGGHNVICGLFAAMVADDNRRLIGFLGGPAGILENRWRSIDASLLECYRNSGGFDLLGSGRTKIESLDQMERCAAVLQEHQIGALVIVGGDDSNTNAAYLAEYFLSQRIDILVIGVPKTIDGDMRSRYVPTSFGFDTASRVYAELVSHIARDTLSAKKYYHFVRLMGRAASHITLEVALQTQPNVALIGEEIAARNLTLSEIVEELCGLVIERARAGKHYGVILVPEGLIEFIGEIRSLLLELNAILAQNRRHMETLRGFTEQSEYLHHKLSKDALYTFASMPIDIQRQMLMERDPHGNVIVSQIETERLLIELMESRLAELKTEGKYTGRFGYQRHFMGYEGRCAAPTNFDADYAFALGMNAAGLIDAGCTGVLSAIDGLEAGRDEWRPMGVPLIQLLSSEQRHGEQRFVIRKGLVDLAGGAFAYFRSQRQIWAAEDHYAFVGPIQYFGPSDICDWVPRTLMLESKANGDDR